jgi:hypothetical protein
MKRILTIGAGLLAVGALALTSTIAPSAIGSAAGDAPQLLAGLVRGH